MSRIALLTRDDLTTDESRATWDRIARTRPRMQGPYNVLMNVPGLASAIADLDDCLNRQGRLTKAEREAAILVTSRRLVARFPWLRHVGPARDAGLDEKTIEAIRDQRYDDIEDPAIRQVARLALAILDDGSNLSDERYAQVAAHLTPDRLIELCALVGLYTTLASMTNLFEVGGDLSEAGF